MGLVILDLVAELAVVVQLELLGVQVPVVDQVDQELPVDQDQLGHLVQVVLQDEQAHRVLEVTLAHRDPQVRVVPLV